MRNIFKCTPKATENHTGSTDALPSSDRTNESDNAEVSIEGRGVTAESGNEGMTAKKAKVNNTIVSPTRW